MSNFSEAVLGTGAILKSVSGIIIFGFLIWSMYFTGHYELGIFKGILAFIVLSFFIGITSMIPFGTTFAPFLFEWWWHDVAFWDFSTPAWVITGISVTANILLVMAMASSHNQADY